jgi:hypothetical protein
MLPHSVVYFRPPSVVDSLVKELGVTHQQQSCENSSEIFFAGSSSAFRLNSFTVFYNYKSIPTLTKN